MHRQWVLVLRQHTPDTAWCAEDDPGKVDDEVWARACTERRILITMDKGLAARSRRAGTAKPPGVVLIRVKPKRIDHVAYVLEALLANYGDRLRGQLTTIRLDGRVSQSGLTA